MRISSLGLLGAAVMLGSCVAVGALAQADPAQPPARRQGRGGRGGFGLGARFGQLTLVNVPADVLATELKLTDEQKTAIAAVRTKMRTDMQAAFQPSADGTRPDRQAMTAKMTEINDKTTKDIDAILKDDQKAQSVALVKNLQSLVTLRVPLQTYSDLKLTADQKTKLAAAAAEVAKDRTAKQAEVAAARQAGDQAKAQELQRAMFGNGQPDDKALAILTADQKEIVTKYIKDNPQRGRRPGGRRPGANAAPQT